MTEQELLDVSGIVTIPLTAEPLRLLDGAARRIIGIMADSGATMAYADGVDAPLIDCRAGSLRDDFDFGAAVWVPARLMEGRRMPASKAEFYALRLELGRLGPVVHIAEPLYQAATEQAVSAFAYVDPANRELQLELERIVTAHLRAIGAWIDGETALEADIDEGEWPVEVSVIIPVRNRERTIGDAIASALSQSCSFPFNVIVVDNLSTDATTAIVDGYAASDARVVHIIPAGPGYGIGGCWNLALRSPQCGRYAVQLDSDDIYERDDVLERIVATFRAERCAMVVGAYTLVDFDRRVLPPGLIDHREWIRSNGPNNLLRVNGMGAPRAFLTSVARSCLLPNLSYGEDYAMALRISRTWRIGRIFDSLYLCRRWDGNSDARPSREQLMRFNDAKDRLRTLELEARIRLGRSARVTDDRLHRLHATQLASWPDAAARYEALASVETRRLTLNGMQLTIQYNPARAVSSNAATDAASIASRPCFLCAANRPEVQKGFTIGPDERFEVLVNPYPIFPEHFTIVDRTHHRQQLDDSALRTLITLAADAPLHTFFYNGPHSGASAPDHMHLQGMLDSHGAMSLPREALRGRRLLRRLGTATLAVCPQLPMRPLVVEGEDREAVFNLAKAAIASMPVSPGEWEPRMNVYARTTPAGSIELVIVGRDVHRPHQYDEGTLLCSPGAADMAGCLILTRAEDFEKIDEALLDDIFSQVRMADEPFNTTVLNIISCTI